MLKKIVGNNFQIYDGHFFIDGDKPIEDLVLVHATNFFQMVIFII